MEDKVKAVMASVFGVEKSAIPDDASPDTVDNWDSLRHMVLIVALEREFSVQFADEQIIKMINMQSIMSEIRSVVKG